MEVASRNSGGACKWALSSVLERVFSVTHLRNGGYSAPLTGSNGALHVGGPGAHCPVYVDVWGMILKDLSKNADDEEVSDDSQRMIILKFKKISTEFHYEETLLRGH